MTVHSVPQKRLPDQVTIDFGPAEVLAPAFLALDQAVRERGIYLSVSHDPDELMDLNRQNMKIWYPLMPMFDPAYGAANADNMFWIRGVDETGKVVLTQAARLFYWPDSSLDEELEAQTFFYPNPTEQAHVGEHCIVGTDAIRSIRGRVCFTGGLWFHPEYRGRGLAWIMPRLTRAYAMSKWYPESFFSVLQQHIISAGLPKVYGWPRFDGPVYWSGNPRFGDWTLAVGWMNMDEAIDDLKGFKLRAPSAAPAIAAE